MAVVPIARAQWTPNGWVAERFGYTDTIHTRNDGQQQGIVRGVRPAANGLIVGTSERYQFDQYTGLTAWASTLSSPLQRIGLFDAIHTGANGQQESDVGTTISLVANSATSINNLSQAIGYSTRYLGNDPVGRSAWIWSPSTGTLRIGPATGVFVGPQGEQAASPTGLDNSGRVIGWAQRYDTTGVIGDQVKPRSAFIHFPGTGSQLIGLIDPIHTRASDGFQRHDPRGMNNSGLVVGVSFRFDTNNQQDPGQSAWVWSAQSGAQRIGLRDQSRYRSFGNLQYAYVFPPTEGGAITGASWTFDPNWTTIGRDAWIVPTPGSPEVRLGFTDAIHTDPFGSQRSEPTAIQRSGPLRVAGYSSRYSQQFGFASGRSAWSWTPTEGLIDIGLRDAEHTAADGDRDSIAIRVLPSGAIIGIAQRYSGTFFRTGQSIWVWTPPTSTNPQGLTRRVGVTDSLHTSGEQFQRSECYGWTESGFIYGVSYRYNGRTDNDTSVGRTAWVYNIATGVQTNLTFNTSASGDAVTQPLSMSEGGVLCGNYYEYSGNQLVVPRAFVWSAADGVSTVNALLNGGPSANAMENAFFTDSWDDATRSGVVYAMPTGVFWEPNDGKWATAYRLRQRTACEAADFNADGVVDFFDYLDFVSVFAANQPGADFNADSVIDFFDYLDFVAAFAAAC